MVENVRPFKRRRRVTADLCDFFSFPTAGDAIYIGPFRSSIQTFLSRHARPIFPPSLFPRLMTWQIMFRVGDPVSGDGGPAVVTLYVVEEDVTRSSRSVYCNQCRVVGWSGHPVCRKRYHFIIPAVENGYSPLHREDGYQKACKRCGNLLHLSDSRCKSCNSVVSEDDLEDWLYLQLEDNTHLLHGVIHSNGFGHLITLNGREGGSKVLFGRDIMDFWNRLCQSLAARKISVMDVSKKYGMEYRLLHAVSKGHPWYGEWGYEFGCGSYAITLDAYKEAVSTLSNTPLSFFSYQRRRPRTQLHDIISFYQSMANSELVTFRDLFSFLLRLIRETHKSSKPEGFEKSNSSATELCAWTRNDVECVEQAMIKVLLAATRDAKWVSMRVLRGALSKAASPRLLDYCLKHLGGKMAANGMVVSTRYNSTSSAIEFRLEPFSPLSNGASSDLNRPAKEHLIRDLRFLYDSILHPQTLVNYRPQARREVLIDSATKLLDCKQFVKDYKPDQRAASNPSAIYIWCHVEVADHTKDDLAPPPELMILPQNASVADLKLEATKVFQDVYAMFKKFEADQMLDYGPLDDSMTIKLLVGSRGSVRIQGRCLGTHGLSCFRMERGIENWTVDCICGAKDDDGERMLACDACGIWQHTRCAGIGNHDAVPAKFVCMRCLSSYRMESDDMTKSSDKATKAIVFLQSCRDAVKTNGHGLTAAYTVASSVR